MMKDDYGTRYPEVGTYYRNLLNNEIVGKVVLITRYRVATHKDEDPKGTNELFTRNYFARYMVPVNDG